MICNQYIDVKWSNSSKRHYTSLGYTFTSMGSILTVSIDDLQKGSNVMVDAKCDECGAPKRLSYNNYNKSIKTQGKYLCLKCTGVKHRLTHDFVANEFKKRGYTLLSPYTGANEPLSYICNMHIDKGIMTKKYGDLYSGHGCRYCGREKAAKACTRPSVPDGFQNVDEYLDHLFSSRGYERKSQYVKGSVPIDYICKRHAHVGIKRIRVHELRIGRNCCRECFLENNTGVKHYRFIRSLTLQDRSNNRMLSVDNGKWRGSIFERDKFSCCVCSKHGGALNAHHILNYAEHPELRFNLGNGVTMCRKCHIAFHKHYGYTKNNRPQLEEFILKNKESQ